MNRPLKYSSLFASFVVAAVIASPACQKKSVPKKVSSAEPVAKVKVTDVVPSNLNRDTELAASVEGYETAELIPRIDGYVGQVNVDIGDRVKKGQLLAVLNVPELTDAVQQQEAEVEAREAEIASRKAKVRLAEAQLDARQAAVQLRKLEQKRFESLVKKGSLSQQRLDEASFAVRAAQADFKQSQAEVESAKASCATATAQRKVALSNLQIAKTMASYRKIVAPFDGLITARKVDPGAYVQPASGGEGTVLLEIARVDKLIILIHLPMELARYLNKGDTVTLHDYSILGNDAITTLNDEPLVISRIANAFDKGSRMMQAEIDIDNRMLQKQTGEFLKPGDYGKVILTLESLEGQPMVPRSALGTDSNGKQYVIFLDRDKKLKKALIDRVLVQDDDYAVIDSKSIQVGDRIVASDLEKAPLGESLEQDRIEEVFAPE